MSGRHLFSLVRIVSARQRSPSLRVRQLAQSRMPRSLIKAISARETSAGDLARRSETNEMLQLFRIRFQLIGFACFNRGRYKLRIIAWKARAGIFSRIAFNASFSFVFIILRIASGWKRAANAGRRRAADGAEGARVVSASGVIITGCRGNNFVLSNALKNNVAAKQTGRSSRSRLAHEPIGYE